MFIIAHYVQIAQATRFILSLCFGVRVCVCGDVVYIVRDLSFINTSTCRIKRWNCVSLAQAEFDLDIAFGTPGFSILCHSHSLFHFHSHILLLTFACSFARVHS